MLVAIFGWSPLVREVLMNLRSSHVPLVVYLVLIAGMLGCQREPPAERAQPPQPASTVDQAAQQAVDAFKTPMDEARGVEGTTRSRKQGSNGSLAKSCVWPFYFSNGLLTTR